ncbi:hypothetical protein DPMN_011725 [Dreissena polymorpha]|uniref:Uncharacterized protein n=1 Tax=Dreissena polymorpha TaxID=45954 RepID=A0A9D4N477_DREPO|nr:hypothetical protein DPMN_011725 [Dreissena polymorpha]
MLTWWRASSICHRDIIKSNIALVTVSTESLKHNLLIGQGVQLQLSILPHVPLGARPSPDDRPEV